MKLEGLNIELTPIPGAVAAFHAEVGAAQWTETGRLVAEQGGRLVAVWGSDARAGKENEGRGFIAHAALVVRGGLVVLSLPLTGTSYPDLSALFPAADRMQRAAFDLLGLSAIGADDRRKWLRH